MSELDRPYHLHAARTTLPLLHQDTATTAHHALSLHGALPILLAQGFGKAAHGKLGGVVAAHARLGKQAEHAGGVDDMAIACGFQVRQKRLGAVDHAPEVDADDPFQVGVVHTLHGARQGHPGIVEHQVAR